MRRLLFAVAGWLLAATVAVVVGLLAVSLLGTGITGEQVRPLSAEDVARALAQVARESSSPSTQPPAGSTAVPNSPVPSPTVPPSAVPTPAAPTTSTGQVTRALHSAGGNVIAQCTGTTVYLVSWTPRQGFDTDDVIRGPAPAAFLKFDSEDLDVLLTIHYRDGTRHRLGLNALVSRAYSAASYAGGPFVEIAVVSHGLEPSGRGVSRTPTVHG